MRDKDDIKTLRVHAGRNVGVILDQLGIAYSRRGPLIQARCLCKQHGGDGDNPTAFSWRADYGRWKCFTHQCDRTHGNDVFGLVRSVLGLNFRDAVKWVDAALSGEDLSEPVAEHEYNATRPRLHIHEPIAEDRLKFLKKDHSYLESRGFDADVLNSYDVGVWRRIGTYMNNRVVIPLRDHQGFVVGFTGRTLLTPEEMKAESERTGRPVRKWIHGRDYVKFPDRDRQDLFITSILYNWHRAKKHLGQDRELIIVEGPLDGYALQQAGIFNWAATLGTTFTPIHRGLLVDVGVNKIRCAYDADETLPSGKTPGDDGYEAMGDIVGDLIELERVGLPIGMDPGSMTPEQIQLAF